ncbi:histone H1-binding protein [Rutstroemia sp. NJR-2017a BBW]|nr:histone H1-binding protein [Rutstroemia sp. NJR-2017a BBW]
MADSNPTAASTSAPSHIDNEEYLSSRVTLADYCARGTASFAQKHYEEAVDHYAKAAELQAEINGEMAIENAEILFLYGRALFKVAQASSNVLGGKASSGDKPKKAKKEKAVKEENGSAEKVIEEAVTAIANGGGEKKKEEGADAKKPLFTFTGDENFEDSEDDEEEGGEDDEDEDNDDLAASFEVLDLARLLFTRRLEQPDESEGKGKEKETEAEDSPMTRHIKERLADTHDLLGEISLENERFPAAIADFRSALTLKQKLFPEESSEISEAHFKLSLALEFASITHTSEDAEGENDPSAGADAQINQPMRDEAVKELELAIQSTKLKLQNTEIELASTSSPDDNDVTREKIKDVKGLIADMEQRLKELRAPPVDLQSILGTGTSVPAGSGSMLNESSTAVEEAKKKATDLTNLVRHKKKPAEGENADASASASGTEKKRKAEDDVEVDGGSDSGKKAKVEEAEADVVAE